MFRLISLVALAAASAFAAPSYTAELAARAVASIVYNIHPTVDGGKCVGIVGGVRNNGTQVDIYDCNGSETQQWQWHGNSLLSTPPSVSLPDLTHWCLDAGNVDEIKNGVQMKIWECFDNLPQQTWTPVTTSSPVALSVDNQCLDLTNGVDADRTILQIWQCTAGDRNQIWNFTPFTPA